MIWKAKARPIDNGVDSQGFIEHTENSRGSKPNGSKLTTPSCILLLTLTAACSSLDNPPSRPPQPPLQRVLISSRAKTREYFDFFHTQPQRLPTHTLAGQSGAALSLLDSPLWPRTWKAVRFETLPPMYSWDDKREPRILALCSLAVGTAWHN